MSAPNATEFDEPLTDDDLDNEHLELLRRSLVDSAGLDSIAEPEPLVQDMIFRDSLVWLQGRPGNGKSFVATDIAGCVGTGQAWQGQPVKQGGVLYIAAEGVSGMRKRVRAWEQSMRRSMTGVQWLPMPVQADSVKPWTALVDLAAELAPALIIVDTQARVTVGMEENAAKDMGVFVQALERLRRACGAAVVVVHHQGRNGDHMRGSTALEGAATTVIQVSKEEDDLTVKCIKQKDAEEFEDVHLRLVTMGSSAVLVRSEGSKPGESGAAQKMGKKWWDTFGDDAVSASKIEKAGIAASTTFYNHIGGLLKSGVVKKETAGRNTYYRMLWDPAPDLPQH